MITKRADELEIGDILLPHPMRHNKRSWKVIKIEPIADRLFIIVEILGDGHPTSPPVSPEEIIGDYWKLDSKKDFIFDVK